MVPQPSRPLSQSYRGNLANPGNNFWQGPEMLGLGEKKAWIKVPLNLVRVKLLMRTRASAAQAAAATDACT